jgi:hypothetical protein
LARRPSAAASLRRCVDASMRHIDIYCAAGSSGTAAQGNKMSGAHVPHENDPKNRNIAILISVIAVLLALSEMGGKSAQTNALTLQLEASDLWNFYQAKTIRQTVLRAALGQLETDDPPQTPAAQSARKRLDERWRKDIDRYESEPDTGEGRKELLQRAKGAEAKRDKALNAYHQFEWSSAAFQIAIVLASSSIVTGVMLLAYAAGVLALGGAGIGVLAWAAPTLLHL